MYRLLLLLSVVVLFISCGSFNEAEGELHYYNTISHGQQLLDLKEALNKNIITRAEYDTLKQRIMNNVLDIPEMINKVDK